MDPLEFVCMDGLKNSFAIIYDEFPVRLICNLARLATVARPISIILTETDMDIIVCSSEEFGGEHATDFLAGTQAMIYYIATDDPQYGGDYDTNPYRDMPNVIKYSREIESGIKGMVEGTGPITILCGNACIGDEWVREWSEVCAGFSSRDDFGNGRINDHIMGATYAAKFNGSMNILNPIFQDLIIIDTDPDATDTHPIVKAVILEHFTVDERHGLGGVIKGVPIAGGMIWRGKK